MRNLSPTQWNILVTLALVAGSAWIWLSRADPAESTQGGIPAPQAGFLAPDFSLLTADGEELRLSQLRGQPVLVNFWASWCPPCKAEMPAIQRAYQDYQDQGFIVLGVNAANQDDREEALAYLARQNLTFPILFDEGGRAAQLYQVRALPTSFFVDARGIIREVVVGGPMSEALLEVRVKQLLAPTGMEKP